jgi:hypothetical protein
MAAPGVQRNVLVRLRRRVKRLAHRTRHASSCAARHATGLQAAWARHTTYSRAIAWPTLVLRSCADVVAGARAGT